MASPTGSRTSSFSDAVSSTSRTTTPSYVRIQPRPVHLQTESYMRLLSSKKVTGSPHPKQTSLPQLDLPHDRELDPEISVSEEIEEKNEKSSNLSNFFPVRRTKLIEYVDDSTLPETSSFKRYNAINRLSLASNITTPNRIGENSENSSKNRFSNEIGATSVSSQPNFEQSKTKSRKTESRELISKNEDSDQPNEVTKDGRRVLVEAGKKNARSVNEVMEDGRRTAAESASNVAEMKTRPEESSNIKREFSDLKISPQRTSSDSFTNFRLIDIREQLEDIRGTILQLQTSQNSQLRDRQRTRHGSVISMTMAEDKIPVIEKSTSSTLAGKGQSSSKKSGTTSDTDFFSNIFAEKVPKAQYDAAKKRNQSLEQQLYRQQVELQRYQDQNGVLVNSLLKKHDHLHALICQDDSPGLEVTSDSGVALRAGSITTVQNLPVDNDTESDITSASQYHHKAMFQTQTSQTQQLSQAPLTSQTQQSSQQLQTSKLPQLSQRQTDLRNGFSRTQSTESGFEISKGNTQSVARKNVEAEVHQIPHGRISTTTTKSLDSDRFELLLQLLQTSLREDQDELRDVIEKSHTGAEKQRTQLADLVYSLYEKMSADKEAQSDMTANLREILLKLKGIEKTQAILAENVWRH